MTYWTNCPNCKGRPKQPHTYVSNGDNYGVGFGGTFRKIKCHLTPIPICECGTQSVMKDLFVTCPNDKCKLHKYEIK